MRYIGNTDFLAENLHLRQIPQNAAEAYNKLVCLRQLERKYHSDQFTVYPASKRRRRIFKIYQAYRAMNI